MITSVTFDCWGTLLMERDFTRSTAHRVQAVADVSGLGHDEAKELLDRAWLVHHNEWTAGRHFGSEGIARTILAELGVDPDDGSHEQLWNALEDAAYQGLVEAVPGAPETLRMLRDRGIRTALVCDTGFSPGRVVRRLLAEQGMDVHLDYLAFSNEVGIPKPSERMFRTALDAIGGHPGQSVHVGDLRRTDIAGAKAFGMRAVRITAVYDDPEGPEADAVISSYDELPAVLRGFGAAI